MAKSEWEVVKNPKTTKNPLKPANGPGKSPKKEIKVEATKTNGVTNGTKVPQKKKPTPRKPIFELNENAVGRLGGSGTGVSAAINAMNLLTAEFTAPERIPPYDKDPLNFPSCKLPKDAREKIVQIMDSVKDDAARGQFLKVLVNNLISSSRRAEGAWGTRALGQLMMQTYPKLGEVTEDILGTETHPGSVLSVIWLYCQAQTPKALMAVLFWLVFPRLKQKKVAEYLPKLLDDIQMAMAKGQPIEFRPSQVSSIILALSDSKLSKTTQKKFTEFYTALREHLKPTAEWISHLLPHIGGSRQIYALPVVIQAIENQPAKSAQALKELATENRLQVQYILDAVPEDILNSKYRNIISDSVHEPVMPSDAIKRNMSNGTKPNGKAAKAPTKSTSGGACSVTGIFKYVLYFLLLVGASSQFQITRPYYTTYAEPYYNLYIKDTVDGVITPKYVEFVEPNINKYVLPHYNIYIAPRVKQVSELCDRHVKPQLVTFSTRAVELYKVHLEPQITSSVKKARPAVTQAAAQVGKYITIVRAKAGEFTEGWGEKVDAGIGAMRVKIDEYGSLTRDGIDYAVESAQNWYKNTNAKEFVYTSLQSAQNTAGDYMEVAKDKSADYVVLGKEKVSEFYEFVLVASVDQRQFIQEKGAVAFAFAGEQLGVVRQLLVEYEVDKYFGKAFEALGRTVLWVGDLVGELCEARWCCATKRLTGLRDSALEVSMDVYDRVSKLKK